MKKKKKRHFGWIIFLAILVFLPLFFVYQNEFCNTTTYNITSSKVTNNHKFILISDLHITKDKSLYDRVIEKCKKCQPEAIFITGDLIDFNTYNTNAVLSFSQKLGKISKVYWVTGNHESALNSAQFTSLKAKLAVHGFEFLDNSTKTIKFGNDYIKVSGLADPLKMDKYGNPIYEPLSDLEGSDKFSILLHHRAEALPKLFDFDFDMFLLGHAHGGQIILPFVGPIYAPGQGYFPKYTEGLWIKGEGTDPIKVKSVKDKRSGIISRGIGASRFKYRLFNMPELDIINIIAEKDM